MHTLVYPLPSISALLQGSLERYHGQDVARLQLPAIPAGGSHTARIWVVTSKPGRVALAVTLQCPALITKVGMSARFV